MKPDPRPFDALYARQVLRATERGTRRAAVAAHEDLKHGLNTLATITSIAPFVGILGTLWMVGFETFRGLGNERSVGLAAVAEGLSRACVPAALGLLVGLHSLWCYRYFRGRLAGFDLEMESESLKLVNQLSLQFGRLHITGLIAATDPSLPYLERYSASASEHRRSLRRSGAAAIALLAAAWCIQVLAGFVYDALPLSWAAGAGFRSVLIVFCCSCLPAYAVWVDLLRRKSASLPLVAAALSLSWCAAGLLFPVLRF